MSKIILVLIFSLSLAACSPEQLFSLVARSDVEQAASDLVNNSQSVVESLEASISAKLASSQQSVKLNNPLSDGSYGYAFRNLPKDNQSFTVEVIAVLPPLSQAEAFYEGWLLNPATGDRKTIGPLFLNQDGSRSTTYTSKTDLAAYTKVEITSQIPPGQLPGQVVLNGDFTAN